MRFTHTLTAHHGALSLCRPKGRDRRYWQPVKSGRLVALTAAALALLVVVVAPAHAADRVIASTPGAFVAPVEAYGGNVVWGQVAVGGAPYVYYVRDAIGTRRLDLGNLVRLREIDVGARRGGGTRAAFLLCRPQAACVVRTHDFRTNTNRTVQSLLRLPGAEGHPAVWKDRFVFTRSGGLFASGPLKRVSRAGVISTDLRASRVAYITRASSGPQDNHGVRDRVLTIRVARLRRGRVRSCFIARATQPNEGGGAVLSDVELTSTHVLWMRQPLQAEPVPGTIRRRRLPARGCPSGPEEHSREILRLRSFAVDRGRFFYTTNNAVLEATDPPLTFAR